MNTFNHTSGKELSIGEASIYYEVLGKPQQPVMLFLHGGAGNIEDFNAIIPEFTSDYQIIGIDSRGHGKSTLGLEKLTYERLKLDVESVLKSLGHSKVSIIGFSDGGIVGYRLAADSHVTVENLITIGGTWSQEDLESTLQRLKGFTVERWKEVMPKSLEQYQRLNPDLDIDRTLERIKGMWIDETSTGYPNDQVKKITCPTLIIRGDGDVMFSRQSAAKLADAIKDSKLLNIPFATHVAYQEQKEIFLSVVKQFLNPEIEKKSTAKRASGGAN